jgi:hypothetical protein
MAYLAEKVSEFSLKCLNSPKPLTFNLGKG